MELFGLGIKDNGTIFAIVKTKGGTLGDELIYTLSIGDTTAVGEV